MPANVIAQPTPNPNAMKYTLDRTISSGPSRTYASAQEAEADPLAAKIFALAGVKQIFILNNFVTVTKEPGAFWPDLGPEVEVILRNHFD